jgi:membrane-associated protease RseP (regulator of RpoE activity)
MHDVKLLNRCLWCLNLILGAGIVLFSIQYLLRAQDSRYLKDFKVDDDTTSPPAKPQDGGDGALRTLSNPVENKAKLPGSDVQTLFKATLKGTLPSEKDPTRGVAFIKSLARNVEVVAYIGEEILHEGKIFDEFRGWTMSTVSKDRALFTNKSGQKVELVIDQAMTPAPGAAASSVGGQPSAPGKSRIGQAYTAEGFKSRLLASADSRQVWGMDQDELEWAAQNADQILDRDFQVAPYAGGGLRIENVNAGSIGAARGMMAGDVVREVNGQPLNNISDVRLLMNNAAMRSQPGIRLTIERAGKPVVVEYRPLPK